MAIFTAMAFLIVLCTMTAIFEGGAAMVRKHKERREWKAIRASHYPRMTY